MSLSQKILESTEVEEINDVVEKSVEELFEKLTQVKAELAELNKANTKLIDSAIEHMQEGKKTGVPYVDAGIADALGESRMALPKEVENLKGKKKKKEKDEATGKEKKAASEKSE